MPLGHFGDFKGMDRKPGPVWKWTEGVVDANEEHLKLWHGNRPTLDRKGIIRRGPRRPAALVARGPGRSFIVQFLVTGRSTGKRSAKILKDVRRELDFYLLEVGRPDPWAYAIYHCNTMADFYSSVHWQWHPMGSKRSSDPHSSRVIRRGGRQFIFRPARPSL